MSVTKDVLGLKRFAGLAAVCLAMASAPVQAQGTFTVLGGHGQYHNLSFNGGYNYSSYWTGRNQVSYGGTSYWIYCIDPMTSWVSSATYQTTSLDNFLGASGRYNTQFNQSSYTGVQAYGYDNRSTTAVMSQLTNLYSHAYNDSLTSVTKASAFSYAVWEIMGESAYGAATGGQRTNETGTAWRTQVDAYLSALSTNSWGNVNGVNLSTTSNFVYTVFYTAAQGGSQSFLAVTSGGGGGTGVPEPGTLALAALALVGVAATGRRAQADKRA
jgi:PEP-CTERM motif